jgi:hypothetical protein
MARSLADRDYVYVWADGVHFNIRLAEERLCALVVVGVRSDGAKELLAVADGLWGRPKAGPSCSATCAVAACRHRCWRSATAPLASGQRCGTCSPPPAPSVAGSTEAVRNQVVGVSRLAVAAVRSSVAVR